MNELASNVGDVCDINPVIEILDKGSVPGGRSQGRTIDKKRPNGDRNVDFGKLPLKDVTKKDKDVLVEFLSDGRKVVTRGHSRTGSPTIDVQGPGKKKRKYSYTNAKK